MLCVFSTLKTPVGWVYNAKKTFLWFVYYCEHIFLRIFYQATKLTLPVHNRRALEITFLKCQGTYSRALKGNPCVWELFAKLKAFFLDFTKSKRVFDRFYKIEKMSLRNFRCLQSILLEISRLKTSCLCSISCPNIYLRLCEVMCRFFVVCQRHEKFLLCPRTTKNCSGVARQINIFQGIWLTIEHF